MGRTPKPLRIRVDTAMLTWPEIVALADQGHEIIEDAFTGDLHLGATCWRMDTQHRKYVPLAIAAARKQRYPREK